MLGLAVVVAALLGAVLVGAAPFRITSSPETVSGEGNSAQFLVHWQQVGSAAAATPNPVPAVLSGAVATPTRLPGASASSMLNAGTVGHIAVTWAFQETVGVTLNTEIELNVQVHYLVGAVASFFSTTVYVETQAAAIGATLTFTFYWDSGYAAGVTLQSQLELSQVCTAVGTCP